jgi:lysophospholipase L1-like esterase
MLSKTGPAARPGLRGLLVNLALLVASTVFALLLCEVGLRLAGRGPLYVSPERGRFWKYDAVLGWAHQPGQNSIFETPQFRTSVRINQEGLRDPEHSYARPNNGQRILVIGDSFTWGYGVEEADRFSPQMQAALNVEVINAGVSGYGTDQELLWLQNEGVKYDFDLVILQMAGNDIGDNDQHLVHTIYYKPQFALKDGQLVLQGTPVPQASRQEKFVYTLTQESALAFFMVQGYFDLLTTYSNLKHQAQGASPASSGAQAPAAPFALTLALVDKIKAIAASKHANFMIVSTPRWWNAPAGVTYPDLIASLRAKGYTVLDVEAQPGFDAERMLIPDDGHWNAAGHKFVAGQLETVIQNNRLLTSIQSTN